MIKQVIKFETEDGKSFDTLAEAEAHESKRNLEIKLAVFLEKHFYNGISLDHIHSGLMESKEELLIILTGSDSK
jgi:hypothetical protein